MFRKSWRYMRALFGEKPDQLEDPDMLLRQAHNEMKLAQLRNRDAAIRLVAEKNVAKASIEDIQKTIENLQVKIDVARKNGDEALVIRLMDEKGRFDLKLIAATYELDKACNNIDEVKKAIRRKETQIRAMTTEALMQAKRRSDEQLDEIRRNRGW